MDSTSVSTSENTQALSIEQKVHRVQIALRDQAKRAFDFIAALIGLILLSPAFAFIAILIKRDSPGPVLFKGLRMGRKGKPFRLLKFRTMYECPESYHGPRVTTKDDERITIFGRWLRDTKINELPQLWNVLIGEMSFVGPRPEDVEITKTWPSGAYAEILSVRPGITSPASILYHDEENLLTRSNLMRKYFESILPDKMRLDRIYVRHHSFFSDIDIIFWTLALLIPRLTKAPIPEERFFVGPFSRFVNRYLSWFGIDLATAFLAVSVGGILWRIQEPLNWGFFPSLILAVGLAVIFSGVNYMLGLNRIVWSHATAEDGVGLLFSSLISTCGVLLINYSQFLFHWWPYPSLPMGMLITSGLFAQMGFISMRYGLRLLTMIAERWLAWRGNSLTVGERVLILGNGEAGQIANWLLRRRIFRAAFSIVGMVDDSDPTKLGMQINGCWMLGGIRDLPNLVQQFDVGIILSTLSNITPEMDEFIFNLSQSAKVRLIFLKDLLWLVEREVSLPTGSLQHPKWLEERLDFRALHDTVTEIPNRRILQDRLRHSLAYSRRYQTNQAIIFIELEGLPKIKETLGRQCSDEILKGATQRLMQCKRESDTLGCLGENDFTMIVENILDERVIPTIVERIRGKLEAPFTLWGNELSITPKVGVSFCTGNCKASATTGTIDVGLCYKCAMTSELTKALNRHENILEK
jgi:diguanylate cyclase (GGDEF)-like protein